VSASSARDARTITRIEKLLDEGITVTAWTQADGQYAVELSSGPGMYFTTYGNDLPTAVDNAESFLRQWQAAEK
jgi:hypothetical protein